MFTIVTVTHSIVQNVIYEAFGQEDFIQFQRSSQEFNHHSFSAAVNTNGDRTTIATNQDACIYVLRFVVIYEKQK